MPELSDNQYEDLARQALLEITPAETIGEYVGTTDEGDGVISVLLASAMPGYPDWNWTVSIAQLPGEQPSVLETELMPAEGALLAPDWVPWSERLAEYKAAQDASDGGDADDDADSDADDDDSDDDDDEGEADDDDSDDEDDDLDDDELDDDEPDEDDILGNDVLHGGDLDGVDIDDLDVADDSDDDDDSDDTDDSDDADDDEGEKTY